MSEKPDSGPSLSDEFQSLADNLVRLMRNTWSSPERIRLQQDIESNLADLSSALQKEIKDFQESDSGKQLKADMQTIHEQIRSSDIPNRVRDEIKSALHVANQELEKVSDKWTPRPPEAQQPPPEEGDQGNPDVDSSS